MKKIISILLVLACTLAFFSCNDEKTTKDYIAEINDMYNAISPSLVTTETTRTFGNYTLVDKSTLKIGMVDGYAATVYEYSNQQLRDIESGSGSSVLDPIETVTGIKEYHEELGYRENGGKWDENGEDFAPATGATALTLTEATVQEFKVDEENKTYSFKVLAADTKAVFGQEIESDVEVTIAHSGADIVGVTLSYSIQSKNKNHPVVQVVVKASYSYESQTITIN